MKENPWDWYFIAGLEIITSRGENNESYHKGRYAKAKLKWLDLLAYLTKIYFVKKYTEKVLESVERVGNMHTGK